jgi:hypothetical protein
MSQITKEMISKLETLNANLNELLKEWQAAPEGEREGLQQRMSEIQDERARLTGLSEAEIAEINAETEVQVKAQIQHEVEIGLALFQGALRGDKAAIKKLKKGSLEFAVAIAEGAISPDDLAKLPLATAFVSAGSKTMSSTKH